jgi:hypothetical protein
MFKLIRTIQAILLFASALVASAQALTYITNFSNNTWYLIPVAEQAPAPKGGIPASLSEGPDLSHQGPQKQVWLAPGQRLDLKPKSTLAIDLYDSMRSQSSIRFSLVDHHGNNPHQVALALS